MARSRRLGRPTHEKKITIVHIGIYSGRPLVAALILAALIGAFFQGKPPHSTEQAQMQALRIDRNAPPKDLETLLDYQIKDYRTGNAKLDANITLQALFIAVTVLLILRRSDSLSVLGNAVRVGSTSSSRLLLVIYGSPSASSCMIRFMVASAVSRS
jgi:hypothetical protein